MYTYKLAFIECEKDRKVVKMCKELLKGQLIESIDVNCILKLKDDMMDYIRRRHLNRYAPQDVGFLEKVLSKFEEPPDLTKPIDTYFAKQGRCQRLLCSGRQGYN